MASPSDAFPMPRPPVRLDATGKIIGVTPGGITGD
jgi:hypothetical protein